MSPLPFRVRKTRRAPAVSDTVFVTHKKAARSVKFSTLRAAFVEKILFLGGELIFHLCDFLFFYISYSNLTFSLELRVL